MITSHHIEIVNNHGLCFSLDGNTCNSIGPLTVIRALNSIVLLQMSSGRALHEGFFVYGHGKAWVMPAQFLRGQYRRITRMSGCEDLNPHHRPRRAMLQPRRINSICQPILSFVLNLVDIATRKMKKMIEALADVFSSAMLFADGKILLAAYD